MRIIINFFENNNYFYYFAFRTRNLDFWNMVTSDVEALPSVSIEQSIFLGEKPNIYDICLL